MRKIFFIALVIAGAFLFTPAARAQFTQVDATVIDPNGIPYAAGTMSAVLVPSNPGGWTLSGNPYSGRVGPLTLDSTGSFQANFGDVTQIKPAGAQWLITVNSNQGGIPSPLGTGAQTFTYTSTGTIISGGSPVSISTQLNALAPALTHFAAGGGTITGCSTAGGIAYENGTAETLTCGPNLTWTNSGQILGMNGTANFQSTVAQATAATTGLLEQITGADTGGVVYSAIFGAIDPTTSGTIATSLVGTIGSAFPSGTGSYTTAGFVAGVQGQVGSGTSGTIQIATGFITDAVLNSGGGTIVNLSGYYALDQLGVGTNNYGFFAALQTVGTNNWGFYSTTGNKDHFGTVTAASLNGLSTPTPAGGDVFTQTIASGTAALGTSAISSGTCAAAVTVSASGTATTDDISADFNADPTGTTGYTPSTNGILAIIKYPTANNVNFKVCNNTGSSITPGAVTLNWRVMR